MISQREACIKVHASLVEAFPTVFRSSTILVDIMTGFNNA